MEAQVNNSPGPGRRARVRQMRAEGLSLRAIADRLWISVGSIYADFDHGMIDIPGRWRSRFGAAEILNPRLHIGPEIDEVWYAVGRTRSKLSMVPVRRFLETMERIP